MAYNLTPIGSERSEANAAVSAIKVTAKGLTIKIKPTTHTHTHMPVLWHTHTSTDIVAYVRIFVMHFN